MSEKTVQITLTVPIFVKVEAETDEDALAKANALLGEDDLKLLEMAQQAMDNGDHGVDFEVLP